MVAAAHSGDHRCPPGNGVGLPREAGIAVRPPGLWGQGLVSAAKEPVADPPLATNNRAEADSAFAKPAIGVTVSACAVHRDAIELGLSLGRTAMAIWQDLVDTRGFTGGYQSVNRFVRKLVGSPSKEACAVIETTIGEDYGKSRVMVRGNRHPAWFRANHCDSSCSLFP